MDQRSNLNSDHLDIQSRNVSGYQLGDSNSGHASVLANANDVRIKDSNFSITTNINAATRSTLHVLYQRVAPNAILNDGGRADNPKCHPGTREEVISLIEKWADAAEGDRIFWLSGPAGGGKTAIMKTITERAAKRGVNTINFFFFRGDSTRQSIQPVVPTLLYQLFEYYPRSKEAVAEIISARPRILDGSVAQQCTIISLLCPILRQSLPAGAPIVLLVDGLDECDVDAERSQAGILCALEGLLTEDGSPFRLLVASRPEARIKMAFNELSLHAQTIFLDGQYRPEKDIQHFVVAEFGRIKGCHPSAHLLPRNWPLSSDIEGIVTKSSGQFIFAATVMRYIAHASTVPSLSLERVKGIVPTPSNSPFMHLDSIYMFILSRVDDLDAALAMFSLEVVRHGSPMNWLSECNSHYTLLLVASCVSELSAIVKLTLLGDLEFYHASFPDFLLDKARSGKYWIDVDAFIAKTLLGIWNKPPIGQGAPLPMDSLPGDSLQYYLLLKLGTPTTEITRTLFKYPSPDWIIEQSWSIKGSPVLAFVQEIQRLYYNKDKETLYCDIIFGCIPQWAQFLAYQLEDLESYSGITPYREYLDYLSNGGLAGWAITVGNSKVAQFNITSILDRSAISEPQTPDHPGTQYLCNIAKEKLARQASNTATQAAGNSNIAPPHNSQQNSHKHSTVSPLKHSTCVKVPSPQHPPSSLSASTLTQRAPLLSTSQIQCAITPPVHPRFQASVPQTKVPGSDSHQLPRAHGSRTGMSPAQQHDQASRAGSAHALLTKSSHPPAPEPSQAVSRSARRGNARGCVVAPAVSRGNASSPTLPTGRGLGTGALPTVPGDAEKETTPSGRGFSGMSRTLTQETERRKSESSKDRGDGGSEKGDSDKDSVVPQAAVVKDSTNTAPCVSSKGHSAVPSSRSVSSPQVNTRKKGATRPGARPVWRG